MAVIVRRHNPQFTSCRVGVIQPSSPLKEFDNMHERIIRTYPTGITPIESGKRTGRNGHPATETDREDKQRPDERVRSM